MHAPPHVALSTAPGSPAHGRRGPARLRRLGLKLGANSRQGRRLLLGDRPTTADLSLPGWDLRYRAHLGWGAAPLVDYPELWAWARALAADQRILGAADRVAAGLDAGPDGAFPGPWGPPAPIDGIDDVRRAWAEPVLG